MSIKTIQVSTPLFGHKEEENLLECIRTGWVSSGGAFIGKFEDALASRVDRKYGIGVANGTAALDIAVRAIGITEGDEVIIPSFTIISCAQAVINSGGVPVVVDADPDTWNMDLEQVENRITPRTKAIMAVHIYGLPVDMQCLLDIAKNHGLKVIEDAAQMHGQTCYKKPCGSFGEISTFSFYSNKNITTGEGGMIVVNDNALAERCRSLRNLCFQDDKRFVHEELGWNYRLTNMQAALGLAQIDRLDEVVKIKRNIGKRYLDAFRDLPDIQLPLSETHYAKSIFWAFGIVFSNDQRERVASYLAKKGIQTRPFFWPMHEQPVFKKMGLFNGLSLPISEYIARNGLYIPCGVGLTTNEQDIVIGSVRDILS